MSTKSNKKIKKVFHPFRSLKTGQAHLLVMLRQVARVVIDSTKDYVIVAEVQETELHEYPVYRLDASRNRGGKSSMWAHSAGTVKVTEKAVTAGCCFEVEVGDIMLFTLYERDTEMERQTNNMSDLKIECPIDGVDEACAITAPTLSAKDKEVVETEEYAEEYTDLMPMETVSVKSRKGGTFEAQFVQWNSDKIGVSWYLTEVVYTAPDVVAASSSASSSSSMAALDCDDTKSQTEETKQPMDIEEGEAKENAKAVKTKKRKLPPKKKATIKKQKPKDKSKEEETKQDENEEDDEDEEKPGKSDLLARIHHLTGKIMDILGDKEPGQNDSFTATKGHKRNKRFRV
jgi:hypothetical protein